MKLAAAYAVTVLSPGLAASPSAMLPGKIIEQINLFPIINFCKAGVAANVCQ